MPETPGPTLREQLVRLRQDSGVSQAELAQWIGVTQTAVSYWESGRRQPGLDDVERWAAALGASPTLLQGSPTAGSNDLRDQIAEALRSERWGSKHAQIGEHRHHGYYAPCGICQGSVAAILDLAMPVVQAALARTRASCCEDGERTYGEMERHFQAALAEQTQRAETSLAMLDTASRERDEAREAWTAVREESAALLLEYSEPAAERENRCGSCSQHETVARRDAAARAIAKTARRYKRERDEALEALAYGAETLRRAGGAEAAVQRVRDLADNAEMTADLIDPNGDRIQFAAVAVRDLRTALDQPTGHSPDLCTDLLCTCAHGPIKPKEDR